VTRRARDGFALAAALVVVIAVALIVAMVVDAAGARARMAAAELDAVRRTSDVESALAAAMGARVDTAAARARAGLVVAHVGSGAPGSAAADIEAIAPGLVRVVAALQPSSGIVRGLIARVAFARIGPDSARAGTLRLIPLPGGAWAPVP
jgi:Tfp pilus assembly protein PilX